MTAYGYTLYKRFSKKKRRHVYYAQFRDARTGGRLSGRSTGHTDRNEARRWCESQLRDGYYVGEGEMRFSEYAKDWWLWDRCPYIRRKLDKNQDFVSIPVKAATQTGVRSSHMQAWMTGRSAVN